MPLSTKVRWKQILLPLLLIQVGVEGSTPKCDKTPMGQEPWRSAGDGGFSIAVAGSPTLYRPGQVYTVTLKGMRAHDGDIEPATVKFIDYLLVAESNLPATEVPNLGTFQVEPGDAMTKFSHRCSHAVKATSAIPKDEITVLWTAPEAGNGCIQLKAMVVERADVWYMDEGGLTYTFCEDDSPMGAAPLVEPCCACDEAKYEVIFEGLWSRHTHPKDYPIDEWKTQFSHMIGASHSIDYDLWKYGELSSPALTMLAATGQPRKLEIDMKRFSKNIRSVIKARGLQQRSNVVGKTFAVFRMDPTNHLLSLVSKMIPSPDWIVGVSMENLCLANCSWVDSRVIDLYPWDAGIKSGFSYNNPGEDTVPREVIRRITACSPDNEESPFYDISCAPLKPVARLHLLKQREYKKQCANGENSAGGIPLNPSWGSPLVSMPGNDIYTGNGIGPTSDQGTGSVYNDNYSGGTYNDVGSTGYSSSASSSSYGKSGDLCEMKEWTEWTECSQTCGQGSQSRTRVWMNPVGSTIANCPKENLFDKRTCENSNPCPTRSYSQGGFYNPFYTEEELLAGYSSPWSRRGLSSDNLRKEDQGSPETKSYLYGGQTDQDRSSVDTSSYSDPGSYRDPYHDPYDKYSGYTKQKGYPPNTNRPGTSNYNPYKSLGYYGYTYGGPPTGHYSNAQQYPYSSSSLDMDRDQIQGDDSVSASCETAEWGEWSDCSTACGQGTRSRKRYYKEQDTSQCSADLDQVESCQENSGCPDRSPNLPTPQKRTRYNDYQESFDAEDPRCAVAEWTDWSPCSQTCGLGYSIRTRVFMLSFVPNRVCEGVRLTQKKDCRLDPCWGDYYDDSPVDSGYSDLDLDAEDYPMNQDPVTIEVMDDYSTPMGPKEPYCVEDPDPGRCRMEITRYYYNPREGNCQEFKYSGCGGNRNSFVTMESCMETCHGNRREDTFKSLMPMSLVREDFVPSPVPCKVSEWSSWSACSVECGRGWMTMTRHILEQPQHGGRECPRKLVKRKKCRGSMCAIEPEDWYQGNWRMLNNDNEDDIQN